MAKHVLRHGWRLALVVMSLSMAFVCATRLTGTPVSADGGRHIMASSSVVIGPNNVALMAQPATPATRPDGTALVAGDIWIETDAEPGICEWTYYLDGATPRWLSRQIFRRRVTPEWLNSGGGEVDAFEGLPSGTDAFLLSLQGPFYSTSVDAGNHVVVNITTKSSNTSHATWDSNGTVTAATWTQVDVALNVFVNLATPTPDDVGFLVSAVVTGAPAMYGALFMVYRVARR